MTALQSIIKEAKSLKKQYPKRYSKWTDYVKQASAIYASKHKGKSPVGKKKSTKKKVGTAKPLSKHKDTKSHNVNIRVVSGIKKKKAVKKSTTLTKVKSILKNDHVRLKHGYNLTKGSVRIGSVEQSEIDFWIKMFAPRKRSTQLEWYRELVNSFKNDSFNVFTPKEKGEAQLRALELILNKKPLQIKY